MKQGDTITISGKFTGLTNSLSSYTVRAMVYCQDAKSAYRKLGFTSGSTDSVFTNSISTNSDGTYSFTITSEMSSNLQGECQVEISLTSGGTTVISENYATFAVQNSVLGTSLTAPTVTPSND